MGHINKTFRHVFQLRIDGRRLAGHLGPERVRPGGAEDDGGAARGGRHGQTPGQPEGGPQHAAAQVREATAFGPARGWHAFNCRDPQLAVQGGGRAGRQRGRRRGLGRRQGGHRQRRLWTLQEDVWLAARYLRHEYYISRPCMAD